MDKELFKKIVYSVMKENGFRRKGNSWYKTTEECIVLLNLQHSMWSSYYFVNLACFLRKQDESISYPQEHRCPIRSRIPRFGANEEDYDQITDLENDMTNSEREKSIMNLLNNYCIPTLNELSSIEGIKRIFEENCNLHIRIHGKLALTSLGIE